MRLRVRGCSSHEMFSFSRLTGYAFGALLLFQACENQMQEQYQNFSEASTKIETALGIEMIYTDSAIITLRISSPKMVRQLYGPEPIQEFPDGLKVEIYNKDGTITGRLTSKYALRKEDTGTFIVRDSVVWRSGKGEQLETEELTWDKNTDKVHTSKFVVLKRPEEILFGFGFESNQLFTQWKVIAIEGRLKSNEISQELTN